MLVGQVESILIHGDNVLGSDKQTAPNPLDKGQTVGRRRVVKQLDNIALVGMVDDKQTIDPGFRVILILEERHSCRVEIVISIALELALLE